jgi:Leucine-rich repeat (LRR) protein
MNPPHPQTKRPAAAVLPCPLLAPTAPQDAAPELQAALPSLEELDLTGNLLWRWEEPAALLSALPGLHTLNLSGNRLSLPPAGAPLALLTGLRALVLNGCGVAWRDVCSLQSAALPCLQELHVAGNGIGSLALEAPPITPAGGRSDGGGNGGGGGGSDSGAAEGGAASAAEAQGAAASSSVNSDEHRLPPLRLPALHSLEVSSACIEGKADVLRTKAF